VECENYAVLKRIVLSSDSISAALRGTIQREVEDESLVVLPLRAPELTTHAGVVWLRKRAVSPLAEKLIAIVRTLAAERAGEAGQASARPLHAEGDGSGH
jgi:DNA-binding transcriptional LysR family regulator